MSSGDTLAAFVAGAVTGGVVALLFAPKTGEETRRTLGFALEEMQSAVKNIADEANKNVAQGPEAALE